MKKTYKDFYGCTATVTKKDDGFKLVMRTAGGKRFYCKTLKSEASCKRVMSMNSDGTMQEVTR